MNKQKVSAEIRRRGAKHAAAISKDILRSRYEVGDYVADALARAHRAFVAELAKEADRFEG
jgi:hypothetical protein